MVRRLAALLPWLGILMAVYTICAFETAVASSLATFGALRPETEASPEMHVPPLTTSSQRTPLRIFLHDATTGRDLEWRCMAPHDAAPAEDLVFDANAWADVGVALCGS